MAALEFRILTNILMEQSLSEALRTGLSEEHFRDPDARMIYKFIHDHWFKPSTYKSIPTMGAVERRFPSFQKTAEDPNEHGALRALINELKMSSFEANMRGLANAFYEWVDADPHEAAMKLKQAIDNTLRETVEARTLDVDDVVDAAEKHYRDAQQGLIYGIPWPWEVMTEDTLGKRPGDFIVFYGRMKTLKTWILMHCAAVDYLDHNCRVAIWSKEMGKEKLTLRLASLFAKVDYQLFKKGKLPRKLSQRAFDSLQRLRTVIRKEDGSTVLQSSKRSLLLMCGRDAPKSIEDLKATVTPFKPDVIYLDSFYHLTPSRDFNANQRWQRIGALAEEVKELAEELRIPIVAVHQANRLGEKTHGNTLADVADADIIAREADLIVRILMKKGGRQLREEEYEVAAEEEAKEVVHPKIPTAGPRFSSKPVVKPGTLVPPVVPKEVEPDPLLAENARKFREMNTPRTGAELALALSGNREGTLEAFTIFAVPGYNFKVSNTNCSEAELKKWVEEDKKAESAPAPVNVQRATIPKGQFTGDKDKAAVIRKLKGVT